MVWRSMALVTAAAVSVATAAEARDSWQSVQRRGEPMVTGSGRIVTQPRAVGNFRRIEMRGASDVDVRLGAAPSLAVSIDDNLQGHLTSRVVNGTLILDSRGSYRTRATPRIMITVPDIEALSSHGSGSAVLRNVANRRLALAIQGSGDLRATGRTGALSATIHGSGNADLRGLAAGRADVSVMGSGNLWVDTNGAVDARSFGSGNVYVLGRPSSLRQQNAGSGRVIVRGR